MPQPVIAAGARTMIGKLLGALASLSPPAAAAARETRSSSGSRRRRRNYGPGQRADDLWKGMHHEQIR
jgi:hypothetical protein